MEILNLIDTLEEVLVQARRLPGGNLVLDRKRVLDVIDQMRLSVPADIREANEVLAQRDQVVADAHTNARRILEQADREREVRVSDTAIMREAEERSHSMLIEAEERARHTIQDADATAAAHLSEAAEAATRQLDDADEYALEVLRRLENQLTAFLESIRMSIASVQERR